MGILGNTPARRMQLFNHDNGDLEFIRRPIVGQSATELDETSDPKRSWVDYYQTLYPFDGYKGVPADAIQLAYSRHFHLEIHDILDENLRPPAGDKMDSPFLSSIAESRAVEVAKNTKPKTIYEKMTMLLGAALLIELLIWGIAYATR